MSQRSITSFFGKGAAAAAGKASPAATAAAAASKKSPLKSAVPASAAGIATTNSNSNDVGDDSPVKRSGKRCARAVLSSSDEEEVKPAASVSPGAKENKSANTEPRPKKKVRVNLTPKASSADIKKEEEEEVEVNSDIDNSVHNCSRREPADTPTSRPRRERREINRKRRESEIKEKKAKKKLDVGKEDEDKKKKSPAKKEEEPKKKSPKKESPPKKTKEAKSSSSPGTKPKQNATTAAFFFGKKKEEDSSKKDKKKAAKEEKRDYYEALMDRRYHPIDDAIWSRGEAVPYRAFAKCLSAVEETSGRLKTIEILANYFRSVTALTPEDLLPSVYLCLNRLAPAYEGVELGVGETILIKAIAGATGRGQQAIKSESIKAGDLGIVAENSRGQQMTMFRPAPLQVRTVFAKLRRIAAMTGNSSQQQKIAIIQSMLAACKDQEPRFIIRSLAGKLRIGLAEQSVLQALAHACVMTPPCQGEEFPPKVSANFSYFFFFQATICAFFAVVYNSRSLI